MDWLASQPVAHRGLHGAGVPENSLAAASAAISRGFPIELDIQFSADGVPFVFHDDTLNRMTGHDARVTACTADEIRLLSLPDGSAVPACSDFLAHVDGRTQLLVEIKTGSRVIAHLPALAELLRPYAARFPGQVAVQSFDPRIVGWFKKHWTELPRGQLSTFSDEVSSSLTKRIFVGHMLANLWTRPDFVACDVASLDRRRSLRFLKRYDGRVLAWTIRSAGQLAAARQLGVNVIFEGVDPTV